MMRSPSSRSSGSSVGALLTVLLALAWTALASPVAAQEAEEEDDWTHAHEMTDVWDIARGG